MDKLLKNDWLAPYASMLDIDLNDALTSLQEKEWTADNFKFATAISVMFSSRKPRDKNVSTWQF